MPDGQVTELTHEMIRILGPHGKRGLKRRDIIKETLPKYAERMPHTISNAITRNRLKKAGKEANGDLRYQLCEEWAQLYKVFDTLTTFDPARPQDKKKKTAADVMPAPESKLAVDVSPEANNFADYATALITQNAEYRATLLNVYNTIGKLLNQPTKEE